MIVDDQRLSTAAPTQTHINNYNIASEDFARTLAALKQLVEVDLVALERDMEAAGAPWTPGRVPVWSPDQK